ncbi:MAG: selenocysteine-specific translation factor, partial [Candidatus Eisenbacteria bacterium]|nr:selenocysteine-specific translation factor [Candidatus Eisenbacteria bacterium]
VPGHERFVRAMLAGAGGIDIILFVIAADEGIMPQTREHMDIIQLLGVRRGVVALTKVDLADEEWLELVTDEVRRYLQQTPLAEAPVVPASAVTGQGKDELLQTIDQLIPAVQLEERGRYPRLPVDRVFTMEGFGTVVTGTLWAGRLREGDAVRILPRGLTSRIKALQVHGERVPEAVAGQRTAVALHAVEREAIARGDWLTTRGDAVARKMVDARVQCVRSAPRPIRNNAKMRFHLGAAEVLGRIVLLAEDELPPGGEAWAQIRLDEPILAERGDRFVLRTYSPARAAAGGTVVLAENRRRRRYRGEDLEGLQVAEKGTPAERVIDRLRASHARGLAVDELAAAVGQPRGEVEEILASLEEQGQVDIVGRGQAVLTDELERAGDQLSTTLEEFQKQNPLRWGMTKSELKSRLADRIHPDVAEAWVQKAAAGGRLHARKDRLRWGPDAIRLTPPLQQLRAAMIADLEQRGFVGPHQKEYLDAVGEGIQGVRPDQKGELLAMLMEEGTIARIPPDILLLQEVLEKVPAAVRDFYQSGRSEMSVAQFKDILGVSRKQAVPLLEYLDRERFTRRQGDVRVPGPRLVR